MRSRAVGAAGVARTTASASIRSGAVVGPATTAKPVSVRASSRTVTPVRTGTVPARVSVSLASPPGRPAKTGWSLCGSWAPSSGPAAASDTSCGTVARAESRRAWPAYTPPSSGSTSRSSTSSPSRLATRSPTERSPSTGTPGCSASTRASPASERTPDSRSSRRSTGTPITERGSGRSAPRVQIRDDCTAGCTTSSPSSWASATPSGRRLSIASAPTSTTTPPTSARRSLPPGSGAASSTVTSWPSWRRTWAAVRPASPPPTTSTRTGPASQTSCRPGRVRVGAARGVSGGLGQPSERAAVEDQRQ